MKFINNIEKEDAPKYLIKKIEKGNVNCPYPLRSGDLITLPKYNKTLTQNSSLYKGVKLYNEFKKTHPNEMKKTDFI